MKRNELSNYEKTWRNLESILLNKRNESEKPTSYTIPTIWHSEKGKSMETVETSVIASSFRDMG